VLKPHPVLRRLVHIATATMAVLIGAGLALFSATPAAGDAAVGYVRLAHLSPDTPKVDVYLDKLGDSTFAEQVFHHVGYGDSSKYLALPVGTYRVSMRAENSPAASPPVITTDVIVNEGAAYTVAGVGRFSGLGLKIFNDDLSRPTGGKAKVRVIQASIKAPIIDVSLPDGTAIADNIAFSETTAYQIVPPGTWTLHLQPKPAGTSATISAPLLAGSVYSLMVTDSANGLWPTLLNDASGGSIAPNGAVEAGAGGEAAKHTSDPNLLPWIGGSVVLVAGLVVLAVRLRTLASRRR
jgi:Domain of unknown function (DUF4397)